MITGELKSQVDKIWDAFWTGGISNPLSVIEQFTYLLFIRRLDESPFTDLNDQGISGVFNNDADLIKVVKIIDLINDNAVVA